MSRSGYVDDLDQRDLAMYRGRVASAIRGKRGQAFLRELAAAMDAMPIKTLIAGELISATGDCCAIGVVCKARGVDVKPIDYDDPDQVGAAVGIDRVMAAEVEYANDECAEFRKDESGRWNLSETPAQRWHRMRKWVENNLKRN